ncbi:MAG: peptidoglycan-binding protein [Rickettsiales bacterium]|nr:peptidoglycan-binding protein [Rickettsiales bacterium]
MGGYTIQTAESDTKDAGISIHIKRDGENTVATWFGVYHTENDPRLYFVENIYTDSEPSVIYYQQEAIEEFTKFLQENTIKTPDGQVLSAEEKEAITGIASKTMNSMSGLVFSMADAEYLSTFQEKLQPFVPQLNITGVYDSQTISAVKQFQQNLGIEVDGLIDPPLLAILDAKHVALDVGKALSDGNINDRELVALIAEMTQAAYTLEITEARDGALKIPEAERNIIAAHIDLLEQYYNRVSMSADTYREDVLPENLKTPITRMNSALREEGIREK